jgi:hypothetical protein
VVVWFSFAILLTYVMIVLSGRFSRVQTWENREIASSLFFFVNVNPPDCFHRAVLQLDTFMLDDVTIHGCPSQSSID